jgi:tetratricopeptide (TPR) repeat protein/LPS sulfotransferase NodH
VPHPHKPTRDELSRQVEAAFERHKRGELRFAAGVYRQVLTQDPDQPAALHYLGLIAQQTGNSQQALRLLERSIEIDPTDPRAHNHLGQVHVALNDKRSAATCFERALQVDPNHVASLNNLANITMARDLLQAIALYRHALALNPDAAFAAYNLAQALNENDSFEEALTLYRRTIALDPRHLQARHKLGVLLEQRGQFAEAIEHYLMVQRLDPRHVSSLANVISIRDYIPDVSTVRRAEEIVKARDASDEERIKLHRGLGKHCERAQDYERAFAHFAEAKSLLRRSKAAFDIGTVVKSMDRIKQTFSRELFAQDRALICDSQRPVFIVGLPRSGTTLTEQILASHPRIFGAGELQDIPKMVKLLRPDYPECVATMDPDALTGLANDYLGVIDRLARPNSLRVTDKMPLNSLHLGFIATLFPESRIIYCRRNPLDIAISCFVELFDLEQDYTTSFGDFGHYFLEHERLMAHWRAVLPVTIHELRYEALIADPEATCRALIAHCGLDWDPACLEFHQTERTVQTPSRWQVRQPIYRTSVGRWQHYHRHLASLIQFLDASGFEYSEEAPSGKRANLPASEPGAVTQTSAPRHSPKQPLRRWDSLPKSLESPIFIVAAPRSGSTLLFETLARSEHLCSVGGEAHWLVEIHKDLRPGAAGVASNRLTADHATDAYRDNIISQIAERLVDSGGNTVSPHDNRLFLEKTPKNALRIPFFNHIFPKARFVFLWRDPRENISSIIEAWRSGRFRTYKQVAGFDGPWSLLLPPGYQQCRNRPLEEIAAFQWDCTNRIIIGDLENLDPDRSLTVCYGDLVADPTGSVARVLDFANIQMDPALAHHLQRPLPQSRYTESAPKPEKWRMNETDIERVLPAVESTWQRLRSFS